MSQTIKTTYETIDMSLAAVLYALGAKLEAVDAGFDHKSSFVFKDSPDLHAVIEGYWRRDLTIEPQALFSALRMLKSRLYAS